MAKEERSNWEIKMKYLKLVNKGIRFNVPLLLDGTDRPAPPKIKWRGASRSFFRRCPPPPGYGIADQVYKIADSFKPPEIDEYDEFDEYDEYSPEVVEDPEDEKNDLMRKEVLLNELQAYDVESIDVASLLHSKGRLFSFLRDVLSNKHACIRAKAAEVITTMVQNHPTSQQLVIEGNGLQLLLRNFTTDLNATSTLCGVSSCKTSRFKTIVAISALIWENKSGITIFRRENGYAALRNALISESVCQRSTTYTEVLNLIEYLLHENNFYNQADDSEVQEAALSGLLLLAVRKGGNSGQLVKNNDKQKQVVLQELPSAALPTVQKKKKKQQFKLWKRIKLHWGSRA